MISLDCEPWLWNAIVQHLKTHTGLACDYLGSLNLRRTIAHRMKITQTQTVANYWVQLQQKGSEWQAFLDEIVVPETAFFRDRVPFEFLREWAADRRLRCSRYPKNGTLLNRQALHNKTIHDKTIHNKTVIHSDAAYDPDRTTPKSRIPQKLRILSLPCSTGEEPYSIAFSLLAAGLTLDQFTIDAIDLSHRSLAIAQRGQYSTQPIGDFWDAVKPYWYWQNGFLQISASVQRSIHFKLGNIVDCIPTNVSSQDSQYDIIFCRNLLIYLDPEVRQQVLQGFHQRLQKDGLLIVGHAETGALNYNAWSALPQRYSFTYQKVIPKNQSLISPLRLSPPLTSPPIVQSVTQKARSATQKAKRVLSKNIPKSVAQGRIQSAIQTALQPFTQTLSGERLLQQARDLADRGQLEAALACCATYLQTERLCGEGYFLMGQICQAIGTFVEADRYLAKAVYLMPNHVDALMQLALLRESQGDTDRAIALRQRIQRIITAHLS